jgi:hypothetical protein
MTTAGGIGNAKRARTRFWISWGFLFAVTAGVAFAFEYFGDHDSARMSIGFAVAIATGTIAHELGYRAGRRDYEPGHPDAVMPPPKRR